MDGVHAEDLTNELAALVHGDKRLSGAVFPGALVRVGRESLTLRLAGGECVDAAIGASGEFGATDIAARFRLADQVRIEYTRTKPVYDSEAALHLHVALKNIELVRAATSREQSQEVAVPSWGSESNLLSVPASLKPVTAAARDSAMAELERVRKVSLDRFQKRPNFVADEITRRYRSEGVGEEWRLLDTLESVIAVKDGGISRENIRRNGKPFNQPPEKLGPMQGQSFGGELLIFDPGCSTRFDFAGLQAIAGRELHAYRFTLPPDSCLYTHTSAGTAEGISENTILPSPAGFL